MDEQDKDGSGVKNLPAIAGDPGSIPEPGVGPLEEEMVLPGKSLKTEDPSGL